MVHKAKRPPEAVCGASDDKLFAALLTRNAKVVPTVKRVVGYAELVPSHII